MTILQNNQVRLQFDDMGRLAALSDADGRVQIPIDEGTVTEPFNIELRTREGRIIEVTPDKPPEVVENEKDGARSVVFTWHAGGKWGELTARGFVSLARDKQISTWTLEIDNRTDCAIWQVSYPRVSGLTAFQGLEGPDWLAEPFLMGEKTADPVRFVNSHEIVIDTWARSQFGCFDAECGKSDIAFSYPGMWAMQFLAYGHPQTGGIYFAAHDGQALFKRFGMYADGGDGAHAALIMKQYPEDRTAQGADFKSFYPVVVGVHEGDWWGASALYREWGLEQFWCRKGPTKTRSDVPEHVKQLDIWYWNWQFVDKGHPGKVVPIIKYIKERFGCEIGFHWYGCAGEGYGLWHVPEIYPYNPDNRRILIEGVKKLHENGVRCIPYINTRLWLPDTKSFQDADGMKWICQDEHGKPADDWEGIGMSMCPTEPPFHDLIRRINNQMIDEIGMDGAYLDQVSGCYAVPCFNKDHDHSPGGHDHWCRGYREMLTKIREDIRSRSPDNFITSESCIECYLDLFDCDLTREISNLNGYVGSLRSIPIPLFHSVYHDYHITYGTVSTFKSRTPQKKFCWDGFRLSEALVFVSGCQLMISGVFAGDEEKEEFAPQFSFMEMLTLARKEGRNWFNLGVWKPPVPMDCDHVQVVYDHERPPKEDIPAILSGCFELDGKLCIALVNHTEEDRKGRAEIDPSAYGLAGDVFTLKSIHPAEKTPARGVSGIIKQDIALPACSAQILVLSPTG